jgi:hypothetical protein
MRVVMPRRGGAGAALCIPLCENITTQIFSFYFHDLPLIDGIILTGIPSRQIR